MAEVATTHAAGLRDVMLSDSSADIPVHCVSARRLGDASSRRACMVA